MQCWQCAEAASGLFCEACGALLPPDPTLDHFERLGVPRQFDLDPEALSAALRARQRKVHPDRFAARGERERMLAMQHSSALNDAARALTEPARRADYMLSLAGSDVGAQDEGRIQLDPMFLMEVIEIREGLSELTGPDAHVERRRMAREIGARHEGLVEDIGRGLDAAHWPPQGLLLAALAQQAAQLRYLERILDEVQRMEAE